MLRIINTVDFNASVRTQHEFGIFHAPTLKNGTTI